MTTAFWLLLICLVDTFYLFGGIWFVQILNYPLFSYVGPGEWITYHRFHAKRLLPVLIVPELIEIGLSIALIWVRPAAVPLWAVWLNIILFVVFQVETAVIQVPMQRALDKGFSKETIQRLTNSNWIRTAILTLQAAVLFYMMAVAI